ncbi:hypothetical protein T12_6897 [Trichinella patagoniensis]|uniref:Uncharacterized protein n=1 Tax=Trichinella patagoniensis TaxID=990121 RepID=A0A0V0ZZU2_9BILA|nr:hypothetical protein T12_6897 [Trichinella patagoniensis]
MTYREWSKEEEVKTRTTSKQITDGTKQNKRRQEPFGGVFWQSRFFCYCVFCHIVTLMSLLVELNSAFLLLIAA